MIQKCRCICYFLLGLRLGFFEKMITLLGHSIKELKTMVDKKLIGGLEETARLSPILIMGAIVNPLMQNGVCMVDAWLCTPEQ